MHSINFKISGYLEENLIECNNFVEILFVGKVSIILLTEALQFIYAIFCLRRD
jgi:hypothetical protein